MGKVESQGIYEKEIEGNKKFFAFIAYDKKEIAEKAIKEYNNIKLGSETDDPLYVGLAESKKKRKE